MSTIDGSKLKPRPFWQHIAIGTGLLLLGVWMMRFDIVLTELFDSKNWPGDLRRIFKLSEIFAHGFGIALILVSIWLLDPKRRKFIPRLIACAAFPPITAHIIKLLAVRKRPTAYLNHLLEPSYPDNGIATWIGAYQDGQFNTEYMTQAFPSAHAALVCGIAIGLSYVYPKGRGLFATVATLACLQRVLFLAHWSSDVVVGISLAFLIAGGLVQNWGIGYLCSRVENRGAESIDSGPELWTPQRRAA